MGSKPEDLKGKIINGLEFIENTGQKLGGSYIWKLKCYCGELFERNSHSVKRGDTLSCGCRPHNTPEDLTNQIFNGCRLIKRTNKKLCGSYIWEIQCHCGEYFECNSNAIKSGHTTSCGCSQYNIENLAGQIINECEFIKNTDKKTSSGNIIWKLRCHCGKYFECNSSSIKNGNIKSCGCLAGLGSQPEDLTGQIINGLEFIESTGQTSHTTYIWKLKCYCGQYFECRSSDIKSGSTRSCGCLRFTEYQGIKFRSFYEVCVAIKLNILNTKWEYENELPIIINNKLHKYYPDFYLPDEKRYIEVKGRQFYGVNHKKDSLFKPKKLIAEGYDIEIIDDQNITQFIGVPIYKLRREHAKNGFIGVENCILQTLL